MWCALTRLGVIGHRDISEESEPIIEAALRRLLVAKGGSRLVGVTCLAPGADQLFAQTVLNLDGRLEVILPAANFRDCHVPLDNLDEFDRLVKSAVSVRVMEFQQCCRQAYMAAGTAMLHTVEAMVAVWDGRPAKKPGGVAEVVGAAARLGLPTSVVWPAGSVRTPRPCAAAGVA